jgi:hypothetical protein
VKRTSASVCAWAAACARVFDRGKPFLIGPKMDLQFYWPPQNTAFMMQQTGCLPDLFFNYCLAVKKKHYEPIFLGKYADDF